jgi:hypothetical protein
MTKPALRTVTQRLSNSETQDIQETQDFKDFKDTEGTHGSRSARAHHLTKDQKQKDRNLTVREAVGVARAFVENELLSAVEQNSSQDWQAIFRLARRLQSRFSPASDDLTKFWPALEAFCDAINNVGASCGHVDFNDPEARWLEFVDCWFKIRMPEGDGPLQLAFRQAQQAPLDVRPAWNRSFVLFVSTAYYLQQLQGDDPILLPVTLVGKLFEKDKMFGSRLISLAVREGFIRVVDPSSSYAEKRAKTYHFVDERLLVQASK